MMNLRNILTVAAISLAAVACSKPVDGQTPDPQPEGTKTVKVSVDRDRVLRNPLNGWVLYLGRSWDENFWTSQGYDNLKAQTEAGTVRVSDYASTAYLRANWNMMEPTEGDYFWLHSDNRLTKMLQSCLDRGLRLSFRVLVDGRDQGQNTPLYVRDAGAKGYEHKQGSKDCWSPYPDDPVFQEKYTKFIEAFGKAFNDNDKVDFIDGYGLGKWGESHALIYYDKTNKVAVADWITSLYARVFTKVPLVINYHRLVGDTNADSWGAVSPDTEPILENAIAKGYCLRHDAFGMNGYYQEWEKGFVAKWNNRRPVLMEGGWVTNEHRYWLLDPCGWYREGHPEDVRRGEFEASAEAKVNMMDFRVNEIQSWFDGAYDYVLRFISEGGYRLYPDQVIIPQEATKGSTVNIRHRWRNLGWGYCPTNIPQWDQCYKVGIALLGSDLKPAYTFVQDATDLSTWLQGTPTTYDSKITLSGVAPGTYTWAIGLVDVRKNNEIGLEVAVAKKMLTAQGWVKLGEITIK